MDIFVLCVLVSNYCKYLFLVQLFIYLFWKSLKKNIKRKTFRINKQDCSYFYSNSYRLLVVCWEQPRGIIWLQWNRLYLDLFVVSAMDFSLDNPSRFSVQRVQFWFLKQLFINFVWFSSWTTCRFGFGSVHG